MPISKENKTKDELILTNVIIATIQNTLITPRVLTDVCQRLNDPQTQLLPLLVLVHSDVLYVTDAAQPSKELALDEEGTDADNRVG
jgi:hypothetical protein